MAARPEDRYPTAAALANDLARWLADEPVSAWREPFLPRARRWTRRHQGRVMGLLAAIVVGVLASLSLTAVITLSNRTIRLKNAEITLQNRKLQESNGQLIEARSEAERGATRPPR